MTHLIESAAGFESDADTGIDDDILKGVTCSNKLVEGRSLNCRKFIECDFTGTVFTECDMRGSSFTASQMSGSLFLRCAMAGCELPADQTIRMVDCKHTL